MNSEKILIEINVAGVNAGFWSWLKRAWGSPSALTGRRF